MPLTPGTLSIGSPISASTSLTWFGATPNLHRGDVGPAVAHRVPQAHVGSDQLHEILVGGHDDGVEIDVGDPRQQGRDDVVRLDPLDAQHRNAQRIDDAMDVGDLRREVVRHLRPVRFVVGVDLVAKRLAGGVEHHDQVVGLRVAEQFQQHRGEAVDRVGREPVGPGQRR
jgi:hypothetical protein